MRSRLFTIAIFLFFLISSFNTVHAQIAPRTSQTTFWENVRFGGGLGLSFGSNNTLISVAPSALYQLNPYVAFGPGLNFTYQKSDFFRSTLYGGSAIVLVNPIRFLQLSTELEQLRVNQTIEAEGGDIDNNFWNTALFLGAGFRTGNFTVGARYNVLFENGDGVYADAWQPFVRVYF